jgi:acetyltransferase-like isoleucine patch superfamily enzyme
MKVFLSELRLYICNHIVAHIPSNFVRLLFYRCIMGFQLAEGVAIHLGARFDCAKKLKIGTNSVINENCRIDPRGGITIGSNVLIAAESIILTADHEPNTSDFRGRRRAVVIENYVFVGTRALILPGVTLHQGAVVAAGAVVSRDVSTMTIVGGVPARKISMRTSELKYSTKYIRWLH